MCNKKICGRIITQLFVRAGGLWGAFGRTLWRTFWRALWGTFLRGLWGTFLRGLWRTLRRTLRRALGGVLLLTGANIALGITLSIAPNTAIAAENNLKVHHFLSPLASVQKDLLQPWADKITAESGGDLQFTIYPAMQLGGKAPQLFDQARRGTADIIWTLAGYTPGRFPRMEVFELPFMAASATVTSQAAYEYFEAQATDEFKDVKVLLVSTHAPGTLHMQNKPIRSLEDLKGVKVRAPTRVTNLMLKSLGATPVGMPVPQLPTAISKGVVDGALIPYEVSLPLRLHELTNSHTDVVGKRGLYTAVFLLVMNKDKFNSLPPKLQKVIEDNSGLAMARTAGQLWDKSEIPGKKAAQDSGDAFYYIKGKELRKWQRVGDEVRRDWIKEMDAKGFDGAALITKAEALIKKYEKGK